MRVQKRVGGSRKSGTFQRSVRLRTKPKQISIERKARSRRHKLEKPIKGQNLQVPRQPRHGSSGNMSRSQPKKPTSLPIKISGKVEGSIVAKGDGGTYHLGNQSTVINQKTKQTYHRKNSFISVNIEKKNGQIKLSKRYTEQQQRATRLSREIRKNQNSPGRSSYPKFLPQRPPVRKYPSLTYDGIGGRKGFDADVKRVIGFARNIKAHSSKSLSDILREPVHRNTIRKEMLETELGMKVEKRHGAQGANQHIGRLFETALTIFARTPYE